jgi:Tfp pilus assembly protein PilP
MKLTLTIGIVVLSIAGNVVAQTPNVIESTRAKLNTVEQQKGADLNAALPGVQRTSAKPSPSSVKATGTTANVAPVASKPVVASGPSKAGASNSGAAISSSTTNTAKATPKIPETKIAKPKTAKSKTAEAKTAEAKTAEAKTVQSKTAQAKTAKPGKAVSSQAVAGDAKAAKSQPAVAVEDTKNPLDAKKDAPKKQISLTGRRDPFLSPVVSRSTGGSGCSNGKRCLAIDQIALKGVVKSETGMIAVVTNALDKAYFLHENDPVFNGYVVRITGDSIVFNETVQDKIGKSLTREVTKKITAPVV